MKKQSKEFVKNKGTLTKLLGFFFAGTTAWHGALSESDL